MASIPVGGPPSSVFPIAMNPEEPRCFVLVDGQVVRVVSGKVNMQGNMHVKERELGLGGGLVGGGSDGGMLVPLKSKRDRTGVVKEHFEGILGEAKVKGTLEVVQVEGGETLEVMHIDTGKQEQVIHIANADVMEGNQNEDHIKFVVPTRGPATRHQQRIRKGSSGKTAMQVERAVSSSKNRHRYQQALPLGSVVTSAGRGSLLTSRPMYSIHHDIILPASGKLHNVIPTNLGTSVFISDNSDAHRGTGMAMNKSTFLPWLSGPPKKSQNSIGTQTQPCVITKTGFNLFFCTFHANGSVETQCDTPLDYSGDVTLCRTGGWEPRVKRGRKQNQEAREEEKEDQRHVPHSSSVLKGNGPLFRAKVNVSEEDADVNDLDLKAAAPKRPVIRRKRGRKRKIRPLSPVLPLIDKENDNNNEKEEEESRTSVNQDETVKERNRESEADQEVVQKKGRGLRTKRRPKRLADMQYITELEETKEPRNYFSCHVCYQPFPTFCRLQRHSKEEHGSSNFSFKCDQCDMIFTRPHNLERHKETKHSNNKKRYACDHCDRRFARQDVLSVHVSMVHLRREKGQMEQSNHGFHCTGCDIFFSRETRLNDHRRGNLRCEECAIDFECRTALRLHCYKTHPSTCSVCGKICNSRQHMYFHRKTHFPNFTCKICSKNFMVRSQYVVHMATHTGERTVPCDVCGRTFAHKTAVSKHKWQEHNENNKKFKCDQCDKCFVYRGKLDSHMRSHTREKPYSCEVCSATFTQRCNLTAHIKYVHGVVVKTVRSDGSSYTELVKYKRPKRASPIVKVEPSPAHSGIEVGITATGLSQEVQLAATPSQPPQMDIKNQVHISQSSLETEAAVYQIVYAYPQ